MFILQPKVGVFSLFLHVNAVYRDFFSIDREIIGVALSLRGRLKSITP